MLAANPGSKGQHRKRANRQNRHSQLKKNQYEIMKTIIVPKSGQRGSVLLVSLVITFIIGLTLASYLIMTQSQNVAVARSQTWNASIALSEAGVEDALAMLNKNGGNFDTIYYWTNSSSLNADGWETLAGDVYHTRRYLGSNYYDSYITNLNNSP